jgi:hypothetical protein
MTKRLLTVSESATLVPAQDQGAAKPSEAVTVERIERASGGVPYKTINEAAAILRKGPRWLASWLKVRPIDRYGEPFYHLAGRTKLFTDRDIDRIRDNLPCPSPYALRDRRNRQVTRYAAPISDRLLSEAQELLSEGSRSKLKSRSSAR